MHRSTCDLLFVSKTGGAIPALTRPAFVCSVTKRGCDTGGSKSMPFLFLKHIINPEEVMVH